MYNKIERLYKKESPHNKITKKIFILYLVMVFLLLLFNVLNIQSLMILVVLIVIIAMRRFYEKELGKKIPFRLNKNNTIDKSFNDMINDKENQLFRNYLNKNNIYNEKTLKCIMDHYRNLVKSKPISDNFWSAITIIVSIVLAFVTKDGFDFNNFKRAIPYIFIFVFAVVMIFFSVKQFGYVKSIFKGNARMFERLEIIFSELYVEFIKESEEINKSSQHKIFSKKDKKTCVKCKKKVKND